MKVKTDVLTVGEVAKLLAKLPQEQPLIIYDENEEKYQDVFRVEQMVFDEERQEELPPTRQGSYPLLKHGEQFTLLTGWSVGK